MKYWSFKFKMIGIITIVSSVAIVIFIVMAFQNTKAIQLSKQEMVINAAEDLLDRIDRSIFSHYADVQAFASSDSARSMDRQRIVSFMNQMVTTFSPNYELMMALDKTGKVMAVNTIGKDTKPIDSKSLLGKDFSGKEWFLTVAGGKLATGTSHVEDLHVDSEVGAVTGGSGKVMSFSAPILSSDGR